MGFDYRTPESSEWNDLDGRPDLVLLSRKQQDGCLDGIVNLAIGLTGKHIL